MANNCLVTKLKAVVNNDNLVKLGVLEFVNTGIENPTGNDTYYKFLAPNDTLNKIKYYDSNGDAHSASYNNGECSGNSTSTVLRWEFYDKYNYTFLQFGALFALKNVDALINCNNVTYISLGGNTIPDYVLGQMDSLVRVNQSQKLSGDVEILAATARKHGRTTGRIKRDWNGGGIKIGGLRAYSETAQFSIVWDADFEWIDNDIDGNTATKIRTNLRTSAERIAEWNAQGITVYVYNDGSLVNTYNPTNQ